MATFPQALALALTLAAACPALAQDAAPSAAVLALRDRFEAEVLAIEDAYERDPEGLRRAAVEIARRVYGRDWAAVRRETQRSLAALPAIDLAPYARLEPRRPFAGRNGIGRAFPLIMSQSKWGLAAARFWDARTVAQFVGAIGASAPVPGGNRKALAVYAYRQTFVPPRAYRGRLDGVDVLAMRNWRSLVVVPYAFSPDGLIVPELAGLRVYPLQH